MIYFDKNKNAYAYEIENYIATVEDEVWAEFATTDKWDIINGEFVDISETEEYKKKQYAIIKSDLTQFISAEADKISYGGFTIVQGENKYLFKTTTDNITRCNSVLSMFQVLPADTIIPWEVWQGDTPTMLAVNANQFKSCFAFGSKMIIEVETIKGAINAEIQELTDDELANEQYIKSFKEKSINLLNSVNTIFDLTEIKSTGE